MGNGHIDNNGLDSSKNSLFNSYTIDICLFVTALLSLMVTLIVTYILCKHATLKSLVTSIALQQIKGMDTAFEHDMIYDIHCTCKIQWYTIVMLLLFLLGIIFVITINVWKLRFRGHLFSNAVKVMLFILDAQYNVPVKLCRVAGSIHLFKLICHLTPECVTLKSNLIWDILELDWKEVSVTLHGNKINLPGPVIIPFRDEFKSR